MSINCTSCLAKSIVLGVKYWIRRIAKSCNKNHFLKYGVGFSTILDNKIACPAFSSFVQGNQLELGIETLPNYRKRELATQTCIALIEYCLANQLEPVWSYGLGNKSSFKLALKISFVPILSRPYFELSV